ncbi:MAG TPA: Hsp20/alpha crystallin family protein [Tepidisphaeraceae bacterium]|nr:Hsp20/alpha crystallin family protein [Tepidisphaeraceae bacterium]
MHKGFYSFFPHQSWTPSVNLYETETAYLVCVDLAGVEKAKIDIEVVQQRLTLKGVREVPPCPPQAVVGEGRARVRLHLMEIDHGAFAREVELPQNVQQEKIVARYTDGMLWIELPKRNGK